MPKKKTTRRATTPAAPTPPQKATASAAVPPPQKATVVELHIAVIVPEGQDPAAVSGRMTSLGYEVKGKLEKVAAFSVQTREVPVQHQAGG